MENNQRPAYPTNGRMHSEMTGLTKREYFTAMAMQGILASRTEAAANGNWSTEEREIAEASVKYADQMLKELSK